MKFGFLKNISLGIATELVYAALIMLAGFVVCLIVYFKI
jgi:hypothetical protein